MTRSLFLHIGNYNAGGADDVYVHKKYNTPDRPQIVQQFCQTSSKVIAERLSARLLIVQRSQLARLYVCIYIYPSHFDYVGAVSVVSSPDY